MRIHSDILSLSDFHDAVSGLPGVFVSVSQHGSRSHKHGFEVSLEGNGYRKNTGFRGASDDIGATWDEWGVFLARLFDVDPNALCGSAKYPAYADGYDFHFKTDDRFDSLKMPGDTHKRHTWAWHVRSATCRKCSSRIVTA